ncbi:MAG: hypothetical protein QXS14_00800 [Desulfurococcaceae archaeon]
MRIYVKLRNGKWILVSSKLEYVITSGKRKVVKHVLAGETVETTPKLKQAKTVLVPSGSVSKLVSRILDKSKSPNGVIIVEPRDEEHYAVKAEPSVIGLVEQIVRELAKSKKGTKSKAEPS